MKVFDTSGQQLVALGIDTGTSNTLSVLSNAVSVLSQSVSVLSNRVSVLSNAVSVVSQAVSVLSNQLSVQSQAISALSNAVSVISQKVSALTHNLFFKDAGTLAAGQTKFTATWAGAVASTPPYAYHIMSRNGLMRNLRLAIDVGPGAGQLVTYTIQKNGVDTALSVSLSTQVSATDLVNTVSVNAGDTLTMKEINSGGGATINSMTAGVELA